MKEDGANRNGEGVLEVMHEFWKPPHRGRNTGGPSFKISLGDSSDKGNAHLECLVLSQ